MSERVKLCLQRERERHISSAKAPVLRLSTQDALRQSIKCRSSVSWTVLKAQCTITLDIFITEDKLKCSFACSFNWLSDFDLIILFCITKVHITHVSRFGTAQLCTEGSSFSVFNQRSRGQPLRHILFWRGRGSVCGRGLLCHPDLLPSVQFSSVQTYVPLPHSQIMKFCDIPRKKIDSLLIGQFRDSVRDSVIVEIIGPYIRVHNVMQLLQKDSVFLAKTVV